MGDFLVFPRHPQRATRWRRRFHVYNHPKVTVEEMGRDWVPASTLYNVLGAAQEVVAASDSDLGQREVSGAIHRLQAALDEYARLWEPPA